MSAGGSKGSSSLAWVAEQTAILGADSLAASVKHHTALDGAVIASTGTPLTLTTATFAFADIEDSDKAASLSARLGLGIGNGVPSATLFGAVSSLDREQINRATLGAGTLTLTDPAGQAALAAGDGQAGQGTAPSTDLAALNRDLTRAQEITRDERAGVSFYGSSGAVGEIGSGLAGIRGNLQQSLDALSSPERLALEALAAGKSITDAVASLFDTRGDIDARTKARALALIDKIAAGEVSAAELKACGKQGSNWLDWLVPSAHAAGVCQQYSSAEIALCLDGLKKVGDVLAQLGVAAALDYFETRLREDPAGFEKAMAGLDVVGGGLLLQITGLDQTIKDAFLAHPGDLKAIEDAVGTFVAGQLVALGKGEITGTQATLATLAVTALVVKLAPKSLKDKAFARVTSLIKGMTGGEVTQAENGNAANRALHELYKDQLRAGMSKPATSDPQLTRFLDDLYRMDATVGSGSTAAAVRHEFMTGQSVGGKFHSQKAADYIRGLTRWLEKNPTARPNDRAAAENVIKDLQNALSGR